MSLITIAITAITKRTWIMPPAANPKNPMAHIITRITAIVYNKFPILFDLVFDF
jgi:hypothetical protein